MESIGFASILTQKKKTERNPSIIFFHLGFRILNLNEKLDDWIEQ